MNKKFEINRTKIKGGCQSGTKVETHNSKSDLPLVIYDNIICINKYVNDQNISECEVEYEKLN